MRRAFTLVELLIVISIIALLLGLVLAGAGLARTAAIKQRTAATLVTVQQGLLTWSAERGGALTPAEHPAAASKATRAAFIRAAWVADPDRPVDADLATTAWPFAEGDAVATAGLALAGVDPRRLQSGGDRARLLLPTDLCADPRLPRFAGVPRWQLGLVAAQIAEWTDYQQLGMPPAGVFLAGPAETHVRYGGRRIGSTDGAVVATALVGTLLERGGHLAELRNAGTVRTAPDDTTLCFDDRLHGPTGASPDKAPWFLEGGTRRTYLLRGTAIYDAWGREVLYGLDARGRIRLESPGKDGIHRYTIAPDGSQVDATRDNVVAGGE